MMCESCLLILHAQITNYLTLQALQKFSNLCNSKLCLFYNIFFFISGASKVKLRPILELNLNLRQNKDTSYRFLISITVLLDR